MFRFFILFFTFSFLMTIASAHNNVVVVPLGGEDGFNAPKGEGADDNNSAANADQNYLVLTSNKLVGAISPSRDTDWYKINFTGFCEILTAEIKPRNGVPCGASNLGGKMSSDPQIDSLIRIYRPDGTTIGRENDDINFTTNHCSRAQFTLLNAGSYFIEVLASQTFCIDCTFPYTLELTYEQAIC